MVRKKAAKKAAKSASSEAAPDNGSRGTGRSTEKYGVGNPTHPVNKRVPERALIKRHREKEEGMKISETGPEVLGDKALMIIDNRNGTPVHVSLIQGMGLTKETDGRLIFVQSNVVHDLMTLDAAKTHFAVKKDGTVIYGQQGFDDVGALDFDMVDIVALMEHNNGVKKG